MIKKIIKEICIALLLLCVILLGMGILFYDFMPLNVTIPSTPTAYEISEDVKNELELSMDTQTQNIIKTYQIDASDLKLYEKTNDYNKGKANPFEELPTTTPVSGNNQVITNGTGNTILNEPGK